MSKITEDKNFFIFVSSDYRGKFEVKIHKDCTQVQIEVGIEDDEYIGENLYFDTDKKELQQLRDMIDLVLNQEK
jgi:hypothetical protein